MLSLTVGSITMYNVHQNLTHTSCCQKNALHQKIRKSRLTRIWHKYHPSWHQKCEWMLLQLQIIWIRWQFLKNLPYLQILLWKRVTGAFLSTCMHYCTMHVLVGEKFKHCCRQCQCENNCFNMNITVSRGWWWSTKKRTGWAAPTSGKLTGQTAPASLFLD